VNKGYIKYPAVLVVQSVAGRLVRRYVKFKAGINGGTLWKSWLTQGVIFGSLPQRAYRSKTAWLIATASKLIFEKW